MPSVHTPLPDLDERDRGDVIVLSDASVEGEDIASILRARGFVVFDVPLVLLEARVASDEPQVVIVDVDQPGAIEQIQRLRETLPGSRAHVFCLGDPLRAAELADVSLTDNVFERPIDIQRLIDRALAVANPSAGGFGARGTTPPPMYPVRPSALPPPESILPPISDFPRAQDPLEIGSFLDEGADPAASLGVLAGGHVRLSPELAAQIMEAEARIRAEIDQVSSVPAPSDEADCPVPPDLLAQLDEPLDASDDLEGTGGLAAALAQAGSSSVSVSSGANTPAPRKVGAGGTSSTDTGLVGRSKTGALTFEGLDAATPAPTGLGPRTSASESAALAPGTSAGRADWTRDGGDVLTPPPSMAVGGASSPRAGSPALGIRLGELLGLRPEDAKRTDTSVRGPVSAAALSASGAMLNEPGSTHRGEEALTNHTASASSLSPLSPPVRFQEPRDIAEGRALFDLRTVPPAGPSARLPTDRGREVSPLIIPPSVGAVPPPPPPPPRAPTDRDDRGVSPAAQSVRPARMATSVGASAGAVIFGDGEGFRPLARAIASRKSGCLSFTSAEGTRRIVAMDGDLVTAASEIADETLVSFLSSRGDLDRDVAARLAGKLPASGRHAGAALIAQGFLAQNDLWPVLRAHAEWLIGKVLLSGPGAMDLEEELPGRLKAEPNVFGGATGAEVFIETARRMLDPVGSLQRLDPAARLDAGARSNLLSECALGGDEDALVRGASGKTVAELCESSGPELASVLVALVELEVLAVIAPVRRSVDDRPHGPDPIDEEAIRKKVRAKMVVVQEGDYFALLGVNRSATSYEIKRAFLDLRRAFEPTRLLTATTVDLHDEVTLILEVVEEAFDILRDERRRERYRRAIEAGPPEG
ncbi:MAG: hypothetical protein HOW73_21325 [Polyangiaceae bacterium]|nr:hypothetical protein [Polyangiaceae bacterium]